MNFTEEGAIRFIKEAAANIDITGSQQALSVAFMPAIKEYSTMNSNSLAYFPYEPAYLAGSIFYSGGYRE